LQASGRGFYDGRGQEVYNHPSRPREAYEELGLQERGYDRAGRGFDDQVSGPEGVYYQSGNAGPSYYDEEYQSNRRNSQDYGGAADPYYQEDEGRPFEGRGEYGGPWQQKQGVEGVRYADEADGKFKVRKL